MKLINLTPHPVVVRSTEGDCTIPADGTVARVNTVSKAAGTIMGLPVVTTTYGDVEGLPAPADGVVYVVSAMVLAATDRDDVVAPDTGPTAMRDDSGDRCLFHPGTPAQFFLSPAAAASHVPDQVP